MSVSIVIITERSKNSEKVKNCWSSLKLKYKDIKTIEFLTVNNQEEGIKKAKHNVVYITPCNMLPTYQTMVLLEQLKPQQCLFPYIHGSNERAGAFSICKRQYRGEPAVDWSSKSDIEVVETTVYEV